MTTFLALHGLFDTRYPHYVNPDHVIHFGILENGEGSELFLADGDTMMVVEVPDQILAQLFQP
jgi:hypothetical protein